MAVSIRFENVVKSFDDHVVVDDVSFTIDPGELFFLLGPSGCGKTTLLRCIAGFYIPEKGRIFIDDRDITRMAPEKRDTGMVFQSYALWPHMSVRENVAFGLNLRKVPKAELNQRVDEALETVRMSDRADYKPNQLSGGQQQRVALARALVIRPKCLLLDEPLSNLDAKLRLEMRAEIRRICKHADLTAVYVTHDQKEALSIADRIAVMDGGRIQQCDEPRKVYTLPKNRFIAHFIGETNFIEAKVTKVEEERVEVSCALGTVCSTVLPAESIQVGETVTVSIRPEMIELGHTPPPDTRNVFTGAVHDTVYLGEMAQHEVNVYDQQTDQPGPIKLKAFEINPTIVTRDDEVEVTKLWFHEHNTVILKQ